MTVSVIYEQSDCCLSQINRHFSTDMTLVLGNSLYTLISDDRHYKIQFHGKKWLFFITEGASHHPYPSGRSSPIPFSTLMDSNKALRGRSSFWLNIFSINFKTHFVTIITGLIIQLLFFDRYISMFLSSLIALI